MRALRWLGLVVLAEVAVACGSSSSPGGRAGAPVPVGFPGGGGGGGGGSAPFTLTVESSRIDLYQGETGSLAVSITATSALTGSVTVTASGLPSGVDVDPLTLSAASPTGTLHFHTEPTAAAPTPVIAAVVARADGDTRTAPLHVTVRGHAGAMDLSFGTAGGFTWSGDMDSRATALVVKEDARVYLAGDIAVPNGRNWLLLGLDDRGNLRKDFGSGGVARDGFGTFVEAAVPELGEILVGGEAESSGYLAEARLSRFDTTGALDPKFGSDGSIIATPSGLGDHVAALAGAADGSIYTGVTGTYDPGDGSDAPTPYLLHELSDGSADASFGGAGEVHFQSAEPGWIRRVLLRDDGRVLVLIAGDHPQIVSLGSDGTPDATFGSAGVLVLSSSMQPATMCFDHGGIRVFSNVTDADTTTVDVRRVLDDGAPDGTFAELRLENLQADGCRENPDGSTVIAATTVGDSHPTLFRIDAGGAFDTGFGRVLLGDPPGEAMSVALDPFGRIVVAGQWTHAGVSGVAAWRVWQ